MFLINAFLHDALRAGRGRVAATDRLLRPAFGMYRVEWPGETGVEFHLSHGDWIRLLRGAGFEIEDLIECALPRPDDQLSLRHAGVGAAVAVRRGVEGAPDWLRRPW